MPGQLQSLSARSSERALLLPCGRALGGERGPQEVQALQGRARQGARGGDVVEGVGQVPEQTGGEAHSEAHSKACISTEDVDSPALASASATRRRLPPCNCFPERA